MTALTAVPWWRRAWARRPSAFVITVCVALLALFTDRGEPRTRAALQFAATLYAAWYYWPAGLAAVHRQWGTFLVFWALVLLLGTVWIASAQSLPAVARVARLAVAFGTLTLFALGAWIVEAARRRRWCPSW